MQEIIRRILFSVSGYSETATIGLLPANKVIDSKVHP